MTVSDVALHIDERKSETHSVDEQKRISHAFWHHDVGQDHEGLKANEVEDELDLDLEFAAKTSLKHLTEIGVMEEFQPSGPDVFVIAEWRDGGNGEIVNGEVEEAAEEALEALADEVEEDWSDSGLATVADGGRSILADEFDVVSDNLPQYLRTTDRPVEVLNDAVQLIEETEGLETSDDYGEIAFINMPYRYRLTEEAEEAYVT